MERFRKFGKSQERTWHNNQLRTDSEELESQCVDRTSPSNNQLSGEIPKELGSLSALRKLRLYNNQLSGQIPKELACIKNMNATDLETLRVRLRALGVKEYVDEFIEKKLKDDKIKLNSNGQVKRLDLSQKGLTGQIPEELGNLSALRELRLYNNQLSGEIPKELGNLSALKKL